MYLDKKKIKNITIILLIVFGFVGIITLFIFKFNQIDKTEIRFFIDNYKVYIFIFLCFILAGIINDNLNSK